MKKLSLLFGFLLCMMFVQAQQFVQYSADSTRIKYATFQEAETATLNVRNIPSGVYVLRVTDADGKEYHRKIVRK